MSKTFRTYKHLNFNYLNVQDIEYEGLDRFKQRSLIIKHFENKLHVIYSYKFITQMFSYLLLIISFMIITTTQLNLYLFLIPISFISFFSSILLNEKYKNNVGYYRMSISIMNGIIFREFKIQLPDIQ